MTTQHCTQCAHRETLSQWMNESENNFYYILCLSHSLIICLHRETRAQWALACTSLSVISLLRCLAQCVRMQVDMLTSLIIPPSTWQSSATWTSPFSLWWSPCRRERTENMNKLFSSLLWGNVDSVFFTIHRRQIHLWAFEDDNKKTLPDPSLMMEERLNTWETHSSSSKQSMPESIRATFGNTTRNGEQVWVELRNEQNIYTLL